MSHTCIVILLIFNILKVVFTNYMMKGFDQVGYIYLEPDCHCTVSKVENWAYPEVLICHHLIIILIQGVWICSIALL